MADQAERSRYIYSISSDLLDRLEDLFYKNLELACGILEQETFMS